MMSYSARLKHWRGVFAPNHVDDFENIGHTLIETDHRYGKFSGYVGRGNKNHAPDPFLADGHQT